MTRYRNIQIMPEGFNDNYHEESDAESEGELYKRVEGETEATEN
jgi:hypothetical protein